MATTFITYREGTYYKLCYLLTILQTVENHYANNFNILLLSFINND